MFKAREGKVNREGGALPKRHLEMHVRPLEMGPAQLERDIWSSVLKLCAGKRLHTDLHTQVPLY